MIELIACVVLFLMVAFIGICLSTVIFDFLAVSLPFAGISIILIGILAGLLVALKNTICTFYKVYFKREV